MSLKLEFVERASVEGANIASLCREYGVSRQTGHKWLRRYRERGYEGLEEESRRPKSVPLATAEDVVSAILAERERHPSWGARKLVRLLEREFGDQTPSERTVCRVLERFSKVRKRVKRRGLNVIERAPEVVAKGPNEVWTIDFKGWWKTANGEHCEPLTIRDAYSRYVLAIELLAHRDADHVKQTMSRLFSKCGIPKSIQCDNGTPFISIRARAGLTSLSVWWTSLGIRVVRSRMGCPQDNGAHERMHADMAAELQCQPAPSREQEKRRCKRWQQEFNHVRPHDALGGKTPAEFYRRNPCKPRPRLPRYPGNWQVRRVALSGNICVEGQFYFVSTALGGHHIALEPLAGLRWRAWFHDLDLGPLELAVSHLGQPSLCRLPTRRRVA